MAKQGETIKQLQAELRDMTLSPSSVPELLVLLLHDYVGRATHHSIFNGIVHVSPVPRDGMALSDRLDLIDIPAPCRITI